MTRRKSVILALGLMTGLAIARVVLTYRSTAPAFDETCHIAAAIELLDHHTYQLDPVHPPLSRMAIGFPLYLAGVRFPVLPIDAPGQDDYNVMGNHILYDDGHFLWKLFLARAAMLPFLVLLTLLVFFWARREFDDATALVSAGLFTTLPMVLALSSIAYTDLPAATMQVAALFALSIWLQKPTRRTCLLVGVALALAFLTKFTSVLFLSASAVSIILCRWLLARRSSSLDRETSIRLDQLGWVGLICAVVVWTGYGFSVGHLREGMQLSTNNMPSFQHFPASARNLARDLVLKDPVVPAPALLRGLATAWVLNQSAAPAYMFGQMKPGGWWYYFPVGILFKSPLSFLLLCAISLYPLFRLTQEGRWAHLVPAVSTLAVFLVTMPVGYKEAIRHVFVVFPLLAILAGRGATFLWQMRGRARLVGLSLLAALLAWQGLSTLRAQSNFIAYFNELAGNDPSKILAQGCDLECGQDVFRLARELQARHVSHANLALWSSADMSRMGLPPFDTLQPFHPVTGWVAIGMRSLRVGHSFHSAYPPEGFAWLKPYRPLELVGKTIWLYDIPEQPASVIHPRGYSEPSR